MTGVFLIYPPYRRLTAAISIRIAICIPVRISVLAPAQTRRAVLTKREPTQRPVTHNVTYAHAERVCDLTPAVSTIAQGEKRLGALAAGVGQPIGNNQFAESVPAIAEQPDHFCIVNRIFRCDTLCNRMFAFSLRTIDASL